MKTRMNFRLISSLLTVLFIQHVSAIDISTKFGKVTDAELKMSVYDKDSTASAVYLFKKGNVEYEYRNDGFRLCYDIEIKIKVLKPEGVSFADVDIPYIDTGKNTSPKETVSQIEATAYNLENGKVIKTELKKNYIFKERVNDRYMQAKFSVPAVKEGTVIEYKYRMHSDYYNQIDGWMMQEDIPVVYSEYRVTIPEYFKFTEELRRPDLINKENKDVPVTFILTGVGPQNMVRCNGANRVYSGWNFPAVKDDTFLWCPDDYKCQVNFELLGFEFPGALYKTFTSDWNEIETLLLKETDFGKSLRMKNPFLEEMRNLPLQQLSNEHKIALIYCFLKEQMSWNGKYAISDIDIRKALKERSGNNAELNLILMSMLRDAGIQSQPVIMSRRNMGILPYTHPSLDKINTFVVAIQNTDSTRVFLDASVTDGYMNVLPPVLMTNRARLINSQGEGKWVDLSLLGRNNIRSIVNCRINEDGDFEGEYSVSYLGQNAANFRKEYKAAKDSLKYIEDKELNNNIKILSYTHEGTTMFSPEVKESIKFVKSSAQNDDYIYINPMIFTHITNNPFTQQDRKLPVEFSYPYMIRAVSTLHIPDGYTVEELPKSQTYSLQDNKGTCRYLIRNDGKQIQLTYLFSMNQVIFSAEEYQVLRDFWAAVSEKNNEMIVLKKL